MTLNVTSVTVEMPLYENVFHLLFHFHPHQTHFHMKGCAQGLVLKRVTTGINSLCIIISIHFVYHIPWCCNKRSNSSFATAIRS